MAAARAGLGRIHPESSILFLCDMQEKLQDKDVYFPQIVSMAARILIKVARLLGVPAVLTEQYPQGLGPTVPELGAQGLRPVSKTCFSMVPSLYIDTALSSSSSLSCSELNRMVALARMQQSGIFLSTSKVLILQLVKHTAHPQFKEIQKIIKEPAPDFGLLGFSPGETNPLVLNSRP
uniref:Isochorismatase domain containing 2b n=1 Tax=Nannospalax galili TaxID=1026970 RepID=A0A8C6QG02_NANGA